MYRFLLHPDKAENAIMADTHTENELAELKKRRTFRKYAYRGVDLDQLLDMTQ